MADPVLERLSRQTNAFFESVITFYNGQDQANWINYLKTIKPAEAPAIDTAYHQYTTCYKATPDKEKCLAMVLKSQSQKRTLMEFLYNGFDDHGGSLRIGFIQSVLNGWLDVGGVVTGNLVYLAKQEELFGGLDIEFFTRFPWGRHFALMQGHDFFTPYVSLGLSMMVHPKNEPFPLMPYGLIRSGVEFIAIDGDNLRFSLPIGIKYLRGKDTEIFSMDAGVRFDF